MDGREDALVLSRRMAELVNGYQTSAAIGAVAALGVADALAGGPAHPADVARRVGADPDALARVLRALADAGIFEALEDGRFALTPLGATLRGEVPGSVRRAAIIATDEWHWRAYGYLTHSLRTGEAGFRPAHGCGFWEYLDHHPSTAAMIDDSMARIAAARAAAFARAYDFGAIARIVDVGGGQGVLLQHLLQAHPHLCGIVFDRPTVAEAARTRLAEAGLSGRYEVVSGDFFAGVPIGGDAYVLSWILHDWDDEAAVQILRNCRTAMAESGRLLVLELVLSPANGPHSSTAADALARTVDLEMLAVVGGRERTEVEFRALFGRAGLTLARVLALEGLPWSVIEGAPA
jgi:O-methyltransferase domain/Dimerisation domain